MKTTLEKWHLGMITLTHISRRNYNGQCTAASSPMDVNNWQEDQKKLRDSIFIVCKALFQY